MSYAADCSSDERIFWAECARSVQEIIPRDNSVADPRLYYYYYDRHKVAKVHKSGQIKLVHFGFLKDNFFILEQNLIVHYLDW